MLALTWALLLTRYPGLFVVPASGARRLRSAARGLDRQVLHGSSG